METPEELNSLKNEVESLNKKLHELTAEELEQVSGGDVPHEVGGEHVRKPDAKRGVPEQRSIF